VFLTSISVCKCFIAMYVVTNRRNIGQTLSGDAFPYEQMLRFFCYFVKQQDVCNQYAKSPWARCRREKTRVF